MHAQTTVTVSFWLCWHGTICGPNHNLPSNLELFLTVFTSGFYHSLYGSNKLQHIRYDFEFAHAPLNSNRLFNTHTIMSSTVRFLVFYKNLKANWQFVKVTSFYYFPLAPALDILLCAIIVPVTINFKRQFFQKLQLKASWCCSWNNSIEAPRSYPTPWFAASK